MSPILFAWRSLSREPARAVLGVAGIVAVGALLFDMLLLGRGLLVSFSDLLRSVGYEVRVTGTDSLPGMGPRIGDASRTVAELRALPEVEEVVPIRFARAWGHIPSDEVREVNLLGTTRRLRGEWRIVAGSDLAMQGAAPKFQMVVNPVLAREFALKPGSSLVLWPGRRGDLSALPAEFRVVGIAEFPFDVEGECTASVFLEAFRTAGLGGGGDEADLLLVATRPEILPEAAVAAIGRARPDLHPFSNEQFLERFRRTDFSYFRVLSSLLTAITAFFAFLLVSTLLTVSVNQRLGEVAALRALGFTRRRVAWDLVLESLLLAGTGALLALPAGYSLALVLDDVLRRLPYVPARLHFFVLEPRAIVLHFVFLLGAALLATSYPVLVVTRLPIAATLRKEIVS